MTITATGRALAVGALLVAGAAAADERPELVIAVDGLYRTMEPINGTSTNGSRIHPNFYDSLVNRNYLEDPQGGDLVPELAVSWEQTSPLVWTIQLREGVTFHDGTEMTAEDVAFSLGEQRVWGDESMAPRGKRQTYDFVRVEATGPYTVEIETERPAPTLINRFITPIGYVVPKDYYLEVGPDEFGQKPIGTGPYRVTSFDAGDHIRMEAFDDYWGGTPPARSLSFKIVPEFSARLAGMVSGEFDFMVNVPTDQEEVVRSYEQLELVKRPIEQYIMFAFQTLDIDGYPDNPLTDANLRKAMVSAIDREALVEALWGDATFVPAPFNYPEFGDYYDEDRKSVLSYAPEVARDYLAAADYGGEELTWNITRGAFPNYETAAEYMVEQWRELGINVRLNIVDSWALALQHPFGLLNMSMGSELDGTPTRPLWTFWGPDSSRASRERDKSWAPTERFVSLGEQFLAATDFAERKDLYLQMVAEWEEVTPGMVLWRNVATWVHQDWIDWTPTTTIKMNLGPGYLQIER